MLPRQTNKTEIWGGGTERSAMIGEENRRGEMGDSEARTLGTRDRTTVDIYSEPHACQFYAVL